MGTRRYHNDYSNMPPLASADDDDSVKTYKDDVYYKDNNNYNGIEELTGTYNPDNFGNSDDSSKNQHDFRDIDHWDQK